MPDDLPEKYQNIDAKRMAAMDVNKRMVRLETAVLWLLSIEARMLVWDARLERVAEILDINLLDVGTVVRNTRSFGKPPTKRALGQ